MSHTAKGKYEYWLTPEGLTKLRGWAREGLVDQQIAHNMGITRETLNVWKNKFSDISDTIKKGKEVVDYEVENALYQKAVGITKTIKKPMKVKQVDYEDGKRVREVENVVMVDEEIYVPPDTTAQIFWLKNRKADKWKDRPEGTTNEEALERLDSVLKQIGGVI